MIKKLKSQKAAVSVLVLITILTFVTVLTGAMIAATTLTKSQLESDMRIQEIYGKDVERVDEIYEELVSVDREGPVCTINTEVMNDTNAKYTFNFNEDVIGFSTEKVNVYNATLLSTNIGESFTLSSSLPTVSTNLELDKKYIITFDYKCVANKNGFTFGLYQDESTTNQIENLEATVNEKHEEYIVQTQKNIIQLKFKADVKDSNNITITNLKIAEVNENEVQKGNFVKIDNRTYTLVTFLNSRLEQFVVLNKNTFTDANNNGNIYSVKMLKK